MYMCVFIFIETYSQGSYVIKKCTNTLSSKINRINT